MLKTVWLTENTDTLPAGRAMLLGGFDGLHVGHKTLISRAKTLGLSVGAMTISGGKSGGNLFTFAERQAIFKAAGIDYLVDFSFAEIKNMSAREFVAMLEERFSPKLFICGTDFRFGKGAQGTAETLKEYTRVRVETVELLQKNGEKVSASSIKRCLENGDVETANELLGERFFALGEVLRDRQVGKTLGFPTANMLYPKEKLAIKKGVYETRVTIDGKEYKGITNYGARPTFEDETECLETHLDGFNGDLYGKTIKVEFVRYMRDIRRFDEIAALQTQLQKDVLEIRKND